MSAKLVFEPLKVAGVVLPNRIARAAHGTGLAHNGVTDEFIAFHRERARGGCGLSILEAGTVHESSHLDFPVHTDAAIAGLARLADAIRPFEMKIFQQLWHGGNLYPALGGGVPLAVSTRPGYNGRVGRPMTRGEIQEIIHAFAVAAVRCQSAGIDGVELHAAHGYLFSQFLSPAQNIREDEYGGPLENRMRFLRETVEAIRGAVGRDFPIGVRIGHSTAPNALGSDIVSKVAMTLCEDAKTDYISVSVGDYFRMDTMIGGMHNPTGYQLPLVAPVLHNITVPRLVTGRIRTIDEAEQLLRDDVADIISMVRAHIADSEIVNKARAPSGISQRACIACNQGCIGGLARGSHVGCVINPAAGVEETLSERLIVSSSAPRNVLVIGGGPAGMEAARVAALAGHKVTLHEANRELGGAVNVARRAPWLHTVGDIIFWLEEELYRLGVDVRLNSYVDADEAELASADVIIIATGSYPRLDGFLYSDPGEPVLNVHQSHVVSSIDILTGGLEPCKTALVLDTCGSFEAMAVIDRLLAEGTSVTYVTNLDTFLPDAQYSFRTVPALERFLQSDVEILLRHRLVCVDAQSCVVQCKQGGPGREVSAERVVLITPNEPVTDLYDVLRGRHSDVRLIGDAASPRNLQIAIDEGHRTARSIA